MPTWTVKGIDGVKFEMRTKEKGHNIPHVHVHYAGKNVSIAFNGEILAGGIKKMKQSEAVNWIIDNADMLHKRWEELH